LLAVPAGLTEQPLPRLAVGVVPPQLVLMAQLDLALLVVWAVQA